MNAKVPDKLKKIRGTYTNHRSRPEVDVEPGVPTVPKSLSAAAKLIWNQTAQLLNDMNCLVLADVFALEGFAKVAAQKAQIEMILSKEGFIVDDRTKDGVIVGIKPHPAVRIHSDLDRRFLAYLSKLGLTPADRVNLVPHQPKDAANQFKDFD